MRRGLPQDARSGREARMRRAAPSARSASPGKSSAPWWHQALLWLLMLASAAALNPNAQSLGSAFLAFLGLWLSYRLALRFAKPPAALIATIAIWLASSLPVYVYVVPFAAHAAAMFAVALFLTMCVAVRDGRGTRARWLVLGVTGILAAVAVARQLDPGWLTSRNVPVVHWTRPELFATAFSTDHGAFLWTPILLVALLGLCVAIRRQPALGAAFAAVGALLLYFVAAYDAPAAASYGGRLLIPLTPICVAGLAALTDALAGSRGRVAWAGVVTVVALMILWNFGLMLQWGTGLIPDRGPVDFRQAARNQVTVVPRAAKDFVIRYVNDRKALVNDLRRGVR